jgi:hypothetical protein
LLNNNFPIQIGDRNDVSSWLLPTRFIAADINGGGTKELVVSEGLSSSTWTLRLFASDGSPQTWKVPVLDGWPYAMVAADLDNNGLLETIVASYSGTQGTLDVFQPDGSERPGWPVHAGAGPSFIAVGDLNRDGHKEIVWSIVHNQLYVLNDGGGVYSSVWPLHFPVTTNNTPPTTGSVVIGDVDGDGFPEIVTTLSDTVLRPQAGEYFTQKLIAIRLDGSIARSWELTGMNGWDMPYVWPGWTPIIGDFNHDGLTEIAAAGTLERFGSPSFDGSTRGIPGIATMLSTGAPYNAVVNDWPMIFHDAQNTSVLQALQCAPTRWRHGRSILREVPPRDLSRSTPAARDASGRPSPTRHGSVSPPLPQAVTVAQVQSPIQRRPTTHPPRARLTSPLVHRYS